MAATNYTIVKRNKKNNAILLDKLANKWTYKQYTSCVRDACEKSLDEEDASFRSCKMIQKLADNCHETGLPMAYAVKMTLYKTEFFEMRDFVEDTFNEVYRTTLKSVSPYKYIKPSALLTYRTEAFLNAIS